MGATRSMYNNYPIAARSTNGITIQHWSAKLHIDKATHLARFYLDELLAMMDASGTRGYVGVCNLGSANYYMHAAARRGCIGSAAAGADGIAFQDGGLNTLGVAGNPTVTDAKVGSITIAAFFKAAHCVRASEIGVEYLHLGAWQPWAFFGSLEEATEATKSYTAISIPYFAAGDTVTIRAFHGNAEGTYYSGTANLTLEAAPLTLKYGSWASTAYAGSYTENVYVGFLPLVTGARFYKTEQMDNIPQPLGGFYILGEQWFEVREGTDDFMEVVAFGDVGIGNWPDGDPGNQYPDATLYIGYLYDNDYQYDAYINTCTINHSGTGRVYINTVNNKVYRNWDNLTNAFTNLFTGFIMRQEDCVAMEYSNGDFVGIYNP